MEKSCGLVVLLRGKRSTFLVSDLVNLQTINVIKTRAEPLNIKVLVSSHLDFDFNDDGTKIFLLYHGAGSEKPRLLEYQLSTPYDLTTISLVTTAGIALDGQGVSNPMGVRFSPNGKRLWITSHTNNSEAH